MKEKSISYKRIFHDIIFLLFVGFLVLHFSWQNGYYDNDANKKATLTEEKIKLFEEDVKKGKKIKVENYVTNLKKDYNNDVSKFGLKTSLFISKYFKMGLNKLFSDINGAVNN